MTLFFVPDISKTPFLTEEESLHCCKVLRLGVDASIQIIDGRGNLYEAEIVVPDKRRTEVRLLSVIENFEQRSYKLHMAVAPTKNIDRFEWAVEKAVEIGVDEITPLLCDHSERRIIKTERLEKIVISASKQSLKAHVAKVNPLTPFNDFIKQQHNCARYIAHCYPENKVLLSKSYNPPSDALVLIGPEGDFSPQEVVHALQSGYQPVSLGNSRLRTETAAVVACHTIALRNE